MKYCLSIISYSWLDFIPNSFYISLHDLLILYKKSSIILNIITCQHEAIHSTHIIISLFIFLIILLHISPHVEKKVSKKIFFFSFLFSAHEGNEEKRIYENIMGMENNKAWTVLRVILRRLKGFMNFFFSMRDDFL